MVTLFTVRWAGNAEGEQLPDDLSRA